MIHEYEIVFIIRPDLDDAIRIAAIERVEATVKETGGHILDRDDWGTRKLAYIINKHAKGHYVLLTVAASPETVLEIERKMRIDDRIIRFLTVKISEAVDLEVKLKEAEEMRKVRAEEARRRAEEEASRPQRDHDDDDDDDNDDEAAEA